MTNFIKYNNIEIINNDKIEAKVNITESTLNPLQIVHGGLIFSLADTVMGLTCSKLGRKSVTLDSSINFISPGVGAYLVATCEIIKDGCKTCVLEAKIKNDTNKLVAIATGTFFYID